MNKIKSRGKSSKYKGVCYEVSRLKWRAYIRIADKLIHIGRFPEEKQAALAYDVMARTHFVDYALFNFPKNKKRSFSNERK